MVIPELNTDEALPDEDEFGADNECAVCHRIDITPLTKDDLDDCISLGHCDNCGESVCQDCLIPYDGEFRCHTCLYGEDDDDDDDDDDEDEEDYDA